jgi:acetyl-CoA carboxylase carboxyltransferase component
MKSKSSSRSKKRSESVGKKYVEEQHCLGKLTARERIDHLLDSGTSWK